MKPNKYNHSYIQKIKSSQVNKLNKNIKKCDQHNMPLKYFCEQCKV